MRHVLASLIVLTMLTISTSGCPWWQHNSDTVVTTAIDCTVESVKKNEPQLLPKVLDILTGGAPDWKAQLKLLETVGLEAFACTLQAAIDLLLQTVATVPVSDGGVAGGVVPGGGVVKTEMANRNRSTFPSAAQRAKQYLVERGFKFKH